MFKPHNIAHDITASHILKSTTCTNCSEDAFAEYTPPDAGSLGWDGGCGSILCTGKNNYLVIDTDGQFLGHPGTMIANNSVIGDNTPNCRKVEHINGHICTRTDIRVIEYESIAADFNTRIMWPVSLSYDGGSYTTETNGWREW